jgi:hypothetical protein
MQSLRSVARLFMRPQVWIPIATFSIFYGIHFWLTLIHPDIVLYGGPGDHTAGIIWLYDRYPDSPWWQFSDKSSYPWGDELWTPVYMLGQIGYVLFWVCSKITGSSVAGYNLFTFIAFLLSYATAYLFIYKRFFKKPIIASMLSLAISFTPMAFYLDQVGHTSYLFMPVYLILSLWLILNIFEKKSAGHSSISLGLLVGATILFDPYFILFIPLAIGLFAGSLAVMRYGAEFNVGLKTIVKRFCYAAASSLVIIIPVLLYMKSQAEAVKALTNSTRGDIMHDAYIYSARISDYILPATDNPFALPFISHLKSSTTHGKDVTFTLFLGWVLMLAVIGVVAWWIRYRSVSGEIRILRILSISFFILAIGAFLFSLPPTIQIFSVTIYTPTWLLATLAPTWRVFARLYFIVQPALILMVAAWLTEYISTKPKRIKLKYVWIVATLLTGLLLVEYLPRNPFDASKFWSFDTSLPAAYATIRDSPAKVLAEYPMREQPHYRGSLYLTGQHLHNKALVNGYSATSPTAFTRMSLMDLSNPQTIPALRYMQVGMLLVWNDPTDKWNPSPESALDLEKTEIYTSQFGKNVVLNLYSINRDGPKRRYVAVIQNNYRPVDDDKMSNIQVPLQSGVSLAIVDLCKEMGLSACGDTHEPLMYKGVWRNETEANAQVTLRAFDSSDTQHIELRPGVNKIEVPMTSSRYILEFDAKLNSKIHLTDQEVGLRRD